METKAVRFCIGTRVRNVPLPCYNQNTSRPHVELSHFCCLLYVFLLFLRLQGGLDMMTSNFNTCMVPTYLVLIPMITDTVVKYVPQS